MSNATTNTEHDMSNGTHTCPRCNGTGRIDAFRHVVQGTCFLCGGTGTVDTATRNASGLYAPPSDGYRAKMIRILGEPAVASQNATMRRSDWIRVDGRDGQVGIVASAAREGRIEIADGHITGTWARRRDEVVAELAAQLTA